MRANKHTGIRDDTNVFLPSFYMLRVVSRAVILRARVSLVCRMHRANKIFAVRRDRGMAIWRRIAHGHASNINAAIRSVFAVRRSRADSKWSRGRLGLWLTSSGMLSEETKSFPEVSRFGGEYCESLKHLSTFTSGQRVVTDGQSLPRKSKVHFRADDCSIGHWKGTMQQ